MIRKWLAYISISLLFISCNKDELKSIVPAYLHVERIDVTTNFSTQGSASDALTTAWVVVDGKVQGTYEVPFDVPIAATGEHRIAIYPGMNLNGISAYRTIFPFYKEYEEVIDLVPEETHYLNAGGDSIPKVTYGYHKNLIVLEDYEDNVGFNFQETPSSDTSLYKTTEADEVFVFRNEPKQGSGKVTLPSGYKFETKTINTFELPTFGADVYVELDYKCDIPFTVGIFANSNTQSIQAPVVTVNSSDGEWKKIYINLVTEVSGYPTASDYNIFIGTLNNSSSTKTLFFDNIKLVY